MQTSQPNTTLPNNGDGRNARPELENVAQRTLAVPPVNDAQQTATPRYDAAAPDPRPAVLARAALHPTVKVVGRVLAPIERVWSVFRAFGPEVMRWWPIYDWMELEAPGDDVVGAVRHFRTHGVSYRERLVRRDDTHYVLQYEYIDSDTPFALLRSAITTVEMFRMGPLETEVHWSSRTEFADPLRRIALSPLVFTTQRRAYYGAIRALARFFNPETSLLDVKIVAASLVRAGLVPPSAYVVVEAEGIEPIRSRFQPLTFAPRWNETLTFNAGLQNSRIRISLWSAQLGRDRLLGSASVACDLDNSRAWVKRTIDLEGEVAGSLQIELRQRPEFETLRDTMSLAKQLGSGPLGQLFPVVRQLGSEIAMVDTSLATLQLYARKAMPQLQDEARSGPFIPAVARAGEVLLTLQIAFSRFRRTAEEVLTVLAGVGEQLVTSIEAGDQEFYEYARYPAPNQDLPRMTKGIPRQELLTPRKLGGAMQRALEFVFAEFDLAKRYTQALREGSNRFFAFFDDKYLPDPKAITSRWQEDTEVCRQMIQGINPLVLKMVRSLDEVPNSLRHLSAQGKSLAALIEARRLFILDYALLAELQRYRNMVFYAPIALVYRELLPEEGKSRLNLVGIQLTRDPGTNVVYTKDTSPPNRYLYAKMQLQCADNQYHQFINHLGIAHLATEPMAIAHHNAFVRHPDHVIGRLLAPHMAETIGINYLARQTLIAEPVEAAFTDRTFAPGTHQSLKLFNLAWRSWNFFGNSFPEELRSRGFDVAGSDGVTDYYYRDDGFLIWNALSAYITAVVEVAYANDEAVAADGVIQNWARECSDPQRADIPGFPRALTTKELLARCLTAQIFQASAFHSAVNFSQADYITFVPNRPDSTIAPMPPGDEDIELDFILNRALPGIGAAAFQISFAILLTLPTDSPLDQPIELGEAYADATRDFRAQLAHISHAIKERNAKLTAKGLQPYPYLEPGRIAASVAI